MSRYYVYHLVDPRTGEVFYVGKGQRTRGKDHLKEAASPAKGSKHPKDIRIRQVLGAGHDVQVEIIQRFVLEADALEFECSEIGRIGLANLTNIMSGYESSKANAEKKAKLAAVSDKDLTPKQESFALKYLELGNASEAYRQVYDAEGMKSTTVNRAAKALLDNSKIAARLAALRERHVKRHEVTVDSITDELIEDRQFAREQGQAAAALAATVHKAKLHGHMAERQEITGKDGGPVVIEDKTPLETARTIAFLLSGVAATPPA